MTYKAASPRIPATDTFTLFFIWIFHNSTAGKMASDQSVAISIPEKKKLTSLFSFRLQDPVTVSPQRVVIGWQMLAIPMIKIMADMVVVAMIM
jgi:hypothetical protein